MDCSTKVKTGFRYVPSLFQPLAPPHRGASTPHSLQLPCGFDGPWRRLCIAAFHLSRSRLDSSILCILNSYLRPFQIYSFLRAATEGAAAASSFAPPTHYPRRMHARPFDLRQLFVCGSAASLHRFQVPLCLNAACHRPPGFTSMPHARQHSHRSALRASHTGDPGSVLKRTTESTY